MTSGHEPAFYDSGHHSLWIMSSSRQSSRQRSSSARSNHSDTSNQAVVPSSPQTYTSNVPPQLQAGASASREALNQSAPRSVAPSVQITSHGAESPYSPNANVNSQYSYAPSPLRPRAQTAAEIGLGHSQVPYRPATRGGPQTSQMSMPYQPGRGVVSGASTMDPARQQYVPAPPPLPTSPPAPQSHIMTLPPPPPRPPPSSHGVSLPPPPGPPPGSSHGMPPSWSSSWGRQQDWERPSILPPPPPLPLGSASHGAYNPSQPYRPAQPAPLFIPPQAPPDSQPLTSATYIPHGDSFGPGVGIPSLHSSNHPMHDQQSTLTRADPSDFSAQSDATRVGLGTRFAGDSTSAISDENSYAYRGNNAPNTPLTRHHNLTLPLRDASDYPSPGPPTATPQNPQPHLSSSNGGPLGNPLTHRRTGSNPSNAPMSPSDPVLQWPVDRVFILVGSQSILE